MRYPIFRPTCPYTMKMLWGKRKLMVQRQGEQPNICPDDANEKQREKEKVYMANLAVTSSSRALTSTSSSSCWGFGLIILWEGTN